MKFQVIIDLLDQEKSKPRSSKSKSAKAAIARSYRKIIKLIEDTYDEDTEATIDMINSLDISDHMKQKIANWIASNKQPKKLPKNAQLRKDLIELMGIGKKKADDLIEQGLKNISSLYNKKWYSQLPESTQAFLKMKPETKIPRDIISNFETWIARESKDDITVVGSYRRQAKFSSDIDLVLVGDPSGFIDLLKSKFPTTIYANGANKIDLIVDIKPVVKIDIFVATSETKIPMIFYATGSQNFNIAIRSKFKKENYTLNQYGLFSKKDNKPVSIKSEQDIFNLAGISYVEPHEREQLI